MTIKYLINKLNLRIPKDQWQYAKIMSFTFPYPILYFQKSQINYCWWTLVKVLKINTNRFEQLLIDFHSVIFFYSLISKLAFNIQPDPEICKRCIFSQLIGPFWAGQPNSNKAPKPKANQQKFSGKTHKCVHTQGTGPLNFKNWPHTITCQSQSLAK